MRIPRPSSFGVPIRQAGVGDVGQWAMLGDHRLVVDEPAGGQDHPATGPDGAGPVVGPHEHADDVPAVDDQRLGAGVGHHASAAGRHGGTEAFHEEAAGGVDALRLVTARYRDRRSRQTGRLSSPPLKSSPASSADSRFGSSQNAARNGTPIETNQSKWSGEPSQ